jgi:hypothetical protein
VHRPDFRARAATIAVVVEGQRVVTIAAAVERKENVAR